MYDLIIIGSGPAGLSAAIYGKRAGLNLLVVEKAPMSGGQVLNTYEVDNYPGMPGINGFDLGMQFRAHADKLAVEFREGCVTSIENQGDKKLVTVEGELLESKTVILASGAEHAHLNVPGEEKLSGRGVSYCATCDGAFFRGRTVAVAGGGDVALEDAIYLAGICEKVYLIHRRDELRAARILQKKVQELPNVEILWNTVVDEIVGTDRVEKIRIRNTMSGDMEEMEMDGVFIAVGIHPNTELFKGLVECDEKGYIAAGEDGVTTAPGIFAAGDVRTKPLRQIVTAVADGANAVAGVQDYFLQDSF